MIMPSYSRSYLGHPTSKVRQSNGWVASNGIEVKASSTDSSMGSLLCHGLPPTGPTNPVVAVCMSVNRIYVVSRKTSHRFVSPRSVLLHKCSVVVCNLNEGKEVSSADHKTVEKVNLSQIQEDEIINEIRGGNRVLLKDLYVRHQGEFITWICKKYRIDTYLAKEIYQGAFTAFYYNIREGKLTTLKSKVKTYLFSIGKNQLLDRFKAEKKIVSAPDLMAEQPSIDHQIMSRYEHIHLKSKMEVLLEKIGDPCHTVLELFYFKHYSMEAIADHMNYKSKQIAAKRKFLCLQQMRNMLQENEA